MIEALRDIQAKLRAGSYRNEEHVRLSLVARLLQELGWDIWNPDEVCPEWQVARTEDGTRVDLALFISSYAPSVLIETKAVGFLTPNLATVERQVRDYNRNNTALFSVITDGQQWRIYYSQTGGEFSRKCLRVLNLEQDDLAEIEHTLTIFLGRLAVTSGNARAEAENYLRLSQRQRAMEDCLPDARRRVQDPPYPSLPDCLVELVRQMGFEINRDEAMSYIAIAGQTLPTRHPVTSVLTPVSAPSPGPVNPRPARLEPVRVLPPDNPGDLRFTRVLEGRIATVSATQWNELLVGGIRLALQQGVRLDVLRAQLSVNLREGNIGERGFKLIPGTNVSIQGMDAGKTARNLVAIARLLRVPLFVRVYWGEGSPFADQTATLAYEP